MKKRSQRSGNSSISSTMLRTFRKPKYVAKRDGETVYKVRISYGTAKNHA